jgi:hypothetical protein
MDRDSKENTSLDASSENQKNISSATNGDLFRQSYSCALGMSILTHTFTAYVARSPPERSKEQGKRVPGGRKESD